MSVSKEAIEAFALAFWPVNAVSKMESCEGDIAKALEAALPFLPIAVEGKVKALTKTQIETLANNIHNSDDYAYTIECLTYHLSAPSSPGKDGGQEVEVAILDVIAERKRQISIGYDAAHDDGHRGGEIIQAEWGVMRRIDDAIDAGRSGDSQAYMRFLTQAAAQLVAEVGRVKRALAKEASR